MPHPPRISGYTFLRNGVKLGYPFVESLKSLSPLCDEIVVALGPCEDDTEARIRAINDPKIRIIHTTWNEGMSDRGFVYAQQKMIAHYNCTGDWAFYLEGDEVLHEDDISRIRETVARVHADSSFEAVAFEYLHFYGGINTVACSPGWYRSEVRLIRNTLRWFAPDGLFSIVMDVNRTGRYPTAIRPGIPIYHYGHARAARYMAKKNASVGKYWGQSAVETAHDYGRIAPWCVKPYAGQHPAVIGEWVKHHAHEGFSLTPEYKPTSRERRHRWAMRVERAFGLDFSKRHYRRKNA